MNGTTPEYSGNMTISEAAAWLSETGPVVVTTHVKPDGDAVGASVALARALAMRSPDRRVDLWYSGVLPDFLADVVGDTPHRHLDSRPVEPADEAEAVVVVDTGAWTQVEPVRAFLATRADRTLIIDHHLNGDADMASRRVVDPSAAAAAQIVAGVCTRLLAVSASRLPQPVATPLYLGLATDTGWFRHSNVRPEVMRLAADLIEAGVPHTDLFRLVEQRDRPGRLRLFGRALNTLELHDHDRIGIMTLTERDFHESHAMPGDTGGFADRLLVIETVAVGVVLTESRERSGGLITKISMRSKDGPDAIDVNQVTSLLGGGGHARAAGARFPGTLTEAREAVLKALTQPGSA